MSALRAPLVFIATLAGSAGSEPRARWPRRLAVLAAAIALPALAAPGGLVALPGPAVAPDAGLATRQAAAAALPFERPGMSFPGSAFYYLADPPGAALVALPEADPHARGGEAGRALGALIDVGAPAKPFFSAASGITHARAQDCLAQAVWYEAASESEAGQRAVAQVVLNRVAHPAWPASVCGVVYQGAERRTGCQFTFTCDGSLARRPSGASWARAQRIAQEALSGSVYAPVGHATHYHTLWVAPYWAKTLDHLGTIGAHRFYRLRGGAGEKRAFTMAYAGMESEPARGGAAQTAALPVVAAGDVAGPVIAYDLGPVPAARQGHTAPAASAAAAAPSPPSAAYVGTGAVKPAYARAGQWKTRPGETPPAEPATPATPSSTD